MPDAALSGGRLLPPLRWLEECSLSGFFRGRPALDELSPTDGAGRGGVKTQGEVPGLISSSLQIAISC